MSKIKLRHIIKLIRLLLFPFSLIYGLVVFLRNKGYDHKVLKSVQFDIPTICVGNLSVGGTGKTPMVEYLIRLLKDDYQTATLSRGYKRRSKGFLQATKDSTAIELGDESMQIWRKYPYNKVFVGANRIMAIPQMLLENEDIECIVLDDAFQHRSLRTHLNIVLTPYQKIYTNDFYLPTGDLRDWKGAAQRANIIVVSKCPEDIDDKMQKDIEQQLQLLPHQQVFFSKITYAEPYHLWKSDTVLDYEQTNILLVCGIANNQLLVDKLKQVKPDVAVIAFTDHHYFSERNIEKIKQKLGAMGNNPTIVTTEKDAMRLLLHKDSLESAGIDVFCLPIESKFIKDQEKFDQSVLKLVKETLQAYQAD